MILDPGFARMFSTATFETYFSYLKAIWITLSVVKTPYLCTFPSLFISHGVQCYFYRLWITGISDAILT